MSHGEIEWINTGEGEQNGTHKSCHYTLPLLAKPSLILAVGPSPAASPATRLNLLFLLAVVILFESYLLFYPPYNVVLMSLHSSRIG